MDPIGISQPVIVAAPTLPAPAHHASAPALPDPSVQQQQQPDLGGQTFDAKVAEQTRIEAIQRAAQQIANIYVVGDQTFSLFKDATGQYITRFTNLRDGKVTYIPEPTLFKLSNSGSSASLLKIQA